MIQDMRVGAAQVPMRLFDVTAAISQIEGTIEQAATQGVDLIVFPESFVGGYPYWRGHASVARETELAARLHASSIRADGVETQQLVDLSKEHGVSAVIGINEQDERPGSATVFNSALLIDREEGLVGKRRKLIPTHTERAYWGRGQGNDLEAIRISNASVGVLLCYEHHMLMTRAALAFSGEEVHCALWPGYWATGEHIADKRSVIDDPRTEIDAVVRSYALATQSFVISANAIVDEASYPKDVAELAQYALGIGGSSIVDPSGRYIVEPVLEKPTLVVGELRARDRVLTKQYLDTMGHYNRDDYYEELCSGASGK